MTENQIGTEELFDEKITEYIVDPDAGTARELLAVAADLGGEAVGNAVEMIDHHSDDHTADDVAADAGLNSDALERGGHEAAVPLARLAALSDDEARRFARKRCGDWPSTDDVRDRLGDALRDAMRDGERTVIQAPTAAGKSHTVATTEWRDEPEVTDDVPVIHLHETREARDEAAEASADADVSYEVLRSGFEACPVARGEHDPDSGDDGDDDDRQEITIDGEAASEFFARMCHDKNVPFSVAHAHAARENDQGTELPCQQGETDCISISQWEGLPHDEDGGAAVNVVHATHQFAHVPSIRSNTIMALDEQPDFAVEIGQERARRVITAFLSLSDSGPNTFEELVTIARGLDEPFEGNGAMDAPGGGRVRDERRRYTEAQEALNTEPEIDWFTENPDAHASAKPLARAVFQALVEGDDPGEDELARGRVVHTPPRFDGDAGDSGAWNREYLTVLVDDENTIARLRSVPDLSLASAVVGLDARPVMQVWQRNAAPEMGKTPILDPREDRLWRVFERGLRVVQVGDATRPAGSGGHYYDRDGDAALVEAINDSANISDVKSGVVPKSVRDEFEAILREHGDDVDSEKVLHFGNEKSRNDLADESVGFVSHCIDPGDAYVQRWLAECGLDARPERTECGICDGEGCDECDGTGERRAHGRGFVGPDADAAERFLASVREAHLAQSAGRYARDPDDPDDDAVVFVRSNALPDDLADVRVPGVQWLPTETQREIVGELRENERATANELADAVGCTKEHVRKTLDRLGDDVDAREGVGEHGATVYRALAGKSTPADASLGATDKIANVDVRNNSTWSLAIHATVRSGDRVGRAAGGETAVPAAGDPSDRPPD